MGEKKDLSLSLFVEMRRHLASDLECFPEAADAFDNYDV
jgi:hypothetical protein